MKSAAVFILSLIAILNCAAGLAAAPVRTLEVAPAAAPANERRVALVIGNGAYKEGPLANPANDAQDMAEVLRALGFKVNLKVDATQRQMKQALREFGADLKAGGVGLFYYAGHGIQSKGRNFLIPVGASVQSEAELEDESVDMSLALAYMEEARNRVNIVIMDACRNDPFARSYRSATRGLAQVDAPSGTFIAYSTGPGSVASDGKGRNGIYTQYLLESLRNPDSDIEKVFKRVRKAVFQETAGKQIPWESSSLIGDLQFNPNAAASGGAVQPAPQPAIDPARFELAFWNEIKDRNNADEYRAYLEQYPNGRFSKVARARIAELSQAVPQVSDEQARPMIGTWNGFYAYDQGGRRSVPFKLTVTSIVGSRFTGLISEPATFGDGTSKFLFANITGNVNAGRVSFIKTYDGTGGQTHSVNYDGMFEVNRSKLRGGWKIEQAGRTVATGSFEAGQN